MNDLKNIINNGVTVNVEIDMEDTLKIALAVFGGMVFAVIIGHSILNAIK